MSYGYWQSVYKGLKTMPISVNLWMLNMFSRLDFRRTLPLLRMPVLIVYSENDPFVTKKEIDDMLGLLPNAKVRASNNPSHFIASRAKQEVADLLIEFMNNK
jgi:pimeloyl-ACP methyl ester carboxylesterase